MTKNSKADPAAAIATFCNTFPPKADMDEWGCDVRFVPKADIHSLLFDHLVGNRE